MDLLDHALITGAEEMHRAVLVEETSARLREDPWLRDELALCRSLGIPHSKFRLWSEPDQAKALAYERISRETCPNCNTRDDEWREVVDGMIRDKDPAPYEPEFRSCVGCQTKAAMFEEDHEPEPGQYLVLRAVR